MLTRNYYKKLAYPITKYDHTMVNANGTEFTEYYVNTNFPSMKAAAFATTLSDNSAAIVLGTGTTVPALDDYTLSGDFITTVSCLSDTCINTEIEGGVKTVRTLLVKNMSSEDITVGEIGWFPTVNYASGSKMYAVLFDRTVLDTPLTIPAGETGQVDYVIITKFGAA